MTINVNNVNNAFKPSRTITIERSVYDALVKDQEKLNALEVGGVDNWEGYSDSLRDFYSKED